MKFIFMGTPEFAVPILEAMASKYEIALVISQPNRVKKKGVLLDTPVAACAKRLGLALYQPEQIKDSFDYMKSIGADYMITAAYGQYVPSKILNLFKNCLNVHGSLLPKHRGGAPIQRCLMEGDEKTGVAIMKMVKKLDAGEVYAMAEYKIEEEDNNTSLFSKLSLIGRDLLMNSLDGIIDGTIKGVAQDEQSATVSPNIAKEEEVLDFSFKATDIVNRIRGLSYDPGAYLVYKDIKLKVLKARVVSDETNAEAGTVLVTKKRIVIKAKDEAVELLEVIYPGKNLMKASDFANGQKLFTLGENILK